MSERFVAFHSLDAEDAPVISALRAAIAPAKGRPMGVETRNGFDELMRSVIPHDDVLVESDTIGGVGGVRVSPSRWRADTAILPMHGGWFNFGSARACCNLVGHIAARAGARVFIPDYRLAPEHPFPAATEDGMACYQGLRAKGINQVALTGDSAGGNLALVLASQVAASSASAVTPIAGVALLSPVTDLTLSGATYATATRADADPLFTRPQVADLVKSYLGRADASLAKHPSASPLYGRLAGMPSIRIHVGDDEVLPDDSLRFVDSAVAAGVGARVDVWKGMPHGFVGSVGRLKAADKALTAVGTFLAERFQAHAQNV